MKIAMIWIQALRINSHPIKYDMLSIVMTEAIGDVFLISCAAPMVVPKSIDRQQDI